jgi:putative ABC transport system ATP-binding protein
MLAMMFSDLPPREHKPRAAKLLETLGLDAAHQARAADRLSIGQQQRVAVARALACSPALVLADEPTASLDPENAAAAIELLKSACTAANAALLCVSHDPALPAHFSRHLTMNQISPVRAATGTPARTPGGSR